MASSTKSDAEIPLQAHQPEGLRVRFLCYRPPAMVLDVTEKAEAGNTEKPPYESPAVLGYARWRMRLRPALSAACFVAIIIVSVNPVMLTTPFSDRQRLGQMLTAFPDKPWYPEYPSFLDEVRAHTAPGDTIALVVPAATWEGGYSFAFVRASYFLTGREVLPILTTTNEPVPDNFARAKYLAVWRAQPPPVGHTVYSGNEGVLIEK